ncbi:uncharacterized protein LOC133304944 [Gastrolobium bilobum]|uniref:uncharacterized protein LOC133304944 n=1 Tax=Gastrolobium bilobum TaxID=150636 RepID=UPI002AB04131|nr:uncharacterized protein LOC133304944 [Gastrolobium bilobum]
MVRFFVRSCLISFFVLLFLLSVASSNRVVKVKDICFWAENPSFCSSLLNSKPGGADGADLVSLAQYSIDIVHANVTNTINLINSLIAHSTTDPKARDHYIMCLSRFGYEGALGDVEHTQRMLRSGNYFGMSVGANDITGHIDGCIREGSQSGPPYHDMSLLPKYGSVVEQVAQIILMISNFLMNSN